MVKCSDCGQEMLKAPSCDFNYIMINFKVYDRDNRSFDINKRCHDCGIINKEGNFHHFMCDMERCPRCGGQLISCDCIKQFIIKSEGNKIKDVIDIQDD